MASQIPSQVRGGSPFNVVSTGRVPVRSLLVDPTTRMSQVQVVGWLIPLPGAEKIRAIELSAGILWAQGVDVEGLKSSFRPPSVPMIPVLPSDVSWLLSLLRRCRRRIS